MAATPQCHQVLFSGPSESWKETGTGYEATLTLCHFSCHSSVYKTPAVFVRLFFHWWGPRIGLKCLKYWQSTSVLQVWASGVSLLITMQEPSHAETFRIIICLVDNHWSMEVVSALINTDIVMPTQWLISAITWIVQGWCMNLSTYLTTCLHLGWWSTVAGVCQQHRATVQNTISIIHSLQWPRMCKYKDGIMHAVYMNCTYWVDQCRVRCHHIRRLQWQYAEMPRTTCPVHTAHGVMWSASGKSNIRTISVHLWQQ